jgi:diguanylate cyclase (GGDEF)-like protein/PAS domain S-box-containing protein
VGVNTGRTFDDPATVVAVLDGVRDAVLFVGADGSVRWANRRLAEMIGADPTEVIGRSVLDLVHPEDLSHVLESMSRSSSGNVVGRFEFRLLGADGATVSVELTGLPHTVAGESGFAVSLRELLGMHDAQDEVSREIGFLRTVISELEVGVFAATATGQVVVANEAFTSTHVAPRILEYLDDWFERASLLDTVTGRPLARTREPMSRVLRGEAVVDLEHAVVGPDGRRRLFRANGTRLVGPTGDCRGGVVALVDVTDLRTAERALYHAAHHDPLTGLGNRVLLQERLVEAVAGCELGGSFALLLLDLDRFKVINDALGHEAGDCLLKHTAERLRSAARPGDTIVRLGGDEFVVLAPGIGDEQQADVVAQRLRRAVGEPLLLGSTDVQVTASIGVALGSAGATMSGLLRDADTAMYQAKSLGRARVELFDEELRRDAVSRMEIEQRLRWALDHDGLRLVVQPIVRAGDQKLDGAEALVRCVGPDGRLVPPGEFLPVALDTGLVSRIDEWMIARAAEVLRDGLGPGGPSIPWISVNVSAQLLQRGDLDAVVAGAVRRTGIDFHRLHLEITETAVIHATTTVDEVLGRLRAQGSALGLDDFGTGFSSLTHLRALPVDVVKIDRSFVDGVDRSEEDRLVVDAVTRLAHALGLRVTAEGVERTTQSDVLVRLGVDLLQGYLFGRPEPPEELGARMRLGALGSETVTRCDRRAG